MITVEFYRADEADPFGTVEYDPEADEFTIDPASSADERVLRNILSEPIFVPVGGRLEDVYASKDPVLFMTHLWRHYKSSQGTRATAAVGAEDDMLDDEEDDE